MDQRRRDCSEQQRPAPGRRTRASTRRRDDHEQAPSGGCGPRTLRQEELSATTSAMLQLSSEAAGPTEQRGKRADCMRGAPAPSSESTSAPSEEEASGERTENSSRKRKWRKSTNTIRREEKEELQGEVQQLRAQLEALKSRVFGLPTEAELASDRRCKAQMVENRRLRRALLAQQLRLAPVHALLDECSLSEMDVGSPIHQFLHLKCDWQSRHDTLAEAKVKAFKSARLFLEHRRSRWDPRRQTRQEQSFEASNSDACIVCWSTMHFERARIVLRGFETVQQYFRDLEIRISDQLAFITVREDDDYGGTEVPQNRFVSTMQNGRRIELNTVFFSQYEAQSDAVGGDRGYGLVVADFVDVDERHPYHPTDRLRRDISSVLEVTSVERALPTSSAGGTQPDIVVVLTIWVYARLHFPAFDVPPVVWRQLWESSENWIKLLHPFMIEAPE